jgi:hypothetical protein
LNHASERKKPTSTWNWLLGAEVKPVKAVQQAAAWAAIELNRFHQYDESNPVE